MPLPTLQAFLLWSYRIKARLHDHKLLSVPGKNSRQAFQFLARLNSRHFEPESATDQGKVWVGEPCADNASRILALLLDPGRSVAVILGENHLERQPAFHGDRKLVAGHQESAIANKADDGARRFAQPGRHSGWDAEAHGTCDRR